MCKGVTRQGWQHYWKECAHLEKACVCLCVCEDHMQLCAHHVPQTLLGYRIPVCATKSQCEE